MPHQLCKEYMSGIFAALWFSNTAAKPTRRRKTQENTRMGSGWSGEVATCFQYVHTQAPHSSSSHLRCWWRGRTGGWRREGSWCSSSARFGKLCRPGWLERRRMNGVYTMFLKRDVCGKCSSNKWSGHICNHAFFKFAINLMNCAAMINFTYLFIHFAPSHCQRHS